MATIQKQLGNVIRILDVDANGQLSTPEDLSIVKAFIFIQDTPDIEVTFPNPSDINAIRTIPIINRGSVAITVHGIVVKPGPVYGLYWDGTAYHSTIVESVGIVSFTENNNAVIIQGNGEENDPLKVDVNISANAGNKLQILSDGLYYGAVYPGSGKLYWVDAATGSDTNDGSFSSPFATITKANSIAIIGSSVAILSGTYTENVTFLSGIYYFAFGNSADSSVSRVRITGNHTFAASVYEGIDFYSNNSVPTSLNGVAGARFIRCNFSRADIATFSNVIEVNTGNSGTFLFVDCSINGDVAVLSTQTTGVTINISRPRSLGSIKSQSSFASINVFDALEIGAITHSAGNLSLYRVARVIASSSGDSIISTAVADPANKLTLAEVSLLQANGTYGRFSKIGDCVYALSAVDRGVNNDTETGIRTIPIPADDIRAGFNPLSYTPNNASVKAHLQAIDVLLSGGSTAVVTQDSSSVSFTGEGNSFAPLTADVKIDPSSENTLISGPDGLLVKGAATSTGRTWWVDYINGEDSNNNGQFGSPFATINKAISEASSGDVIRIFPGAYTEDIILDDSTKQNLQFEGFGIVDASIVELLGHVTISGNYTRPKMKNIAIIGQISGQSALILDGCEGRLKYENVSIQHAGGSTEKAIEFIGDCKRWYEFTNCGVTGRIVLDDEDQVSPLEVNILNIYDTTPELLLNDDTANVYVSGKRIGNVVHHAGKLTLDNITYFDPSTTPAVLSDSDTGSIRLNNVALIDSSGNWVKFEKTGTCNYSLSNVVREYDENEVLTGTNTQTVLARDIHAAYSPSVYLPSSSSVSDHLHGIDVLLSKNVEVVLTMTGGWIADELIFVYPIKTGFSLPQDLAETLFYIEADVGLTTSFELYKNGVLFGEASFTGTTVTVVSDETSFAENDVLKLVATTNATFDVIAMTLMADKV